MAESKTDALQKMEDDKLTNKLKKSLNEAADRLEKRCEEIKQQLFEVKESIKNKASDIMADFKMRGKEALNRVSEFVGLKEKLIGIRDKVKAPEAHERVWPIPLCVPLTPVT